VSAELAGSNAGALYRLLGSKLEAERAHIRFDATDLVLPKQAKALLRGFPVEIAHGNTVTIVPAHA
jgi:hypothetical protein